MPENQLAIAKLYIHFCCTTYDESLTLALPSSRLFPHPSYFAWLLLLIEWVLRDFSFKTHSYIMHLKGSKVVGAATVTSLERDLWYTKIDKVGRFWLG